MRNQMKDFLHILAAATRFQLCVFVEIYSHCTLFLFFPRSEKRYWNKEIILRRYRTALMVLIQAPKGCSPAHACQTQGKGSLNDITGCFLSAQTHLMQRNQQLEQAQKNQTHPCSTDCIFRLQRSLIPSLMSYRDFTGPFGWLHPKYNELSEAGWTQT